MFLTPWDILENVRDNRSAAGILVLKMKFQLDRAVIMRMTALNVSLAICVMRMVISSQMEEALSLPSEKMSLIPWDTSENVPAKRHAAGSPLCPMMRTRVLTFYLLSLMNQPAVIL